MNIGAIIQARYGATRLPGKVLLPLPYQSSHTVIEQIYRRVKTVEKINTVFVATSSQKTDDVIEKISRHHHLHCYRGSETNVLSRIYHAAASHRLDVLVKCNADNPCVDPLLINQALKKHLYTQADYTTLKHYPLGFVAEIITFSALKKTYHHAKTAFETEHVTPYIYQHPQEFDIEVIKAPTKYRDDTIRLTMDTQSDYALLCALYGFLYNQNPYFGVREIITLFRRKPWLKLINHHIQQKTDSTKYV